VVVSAVVVTAVTAAAAAVATATAVAVAASAGGRTVVRAPHTGARELAHARSHARTYTRKYTRTRAQPLHITRTRTRWGSRVVGGLHKGGSERDGRRVITGRRRRGGHRHRIGRQLPLLFARTPPPLIALYIYICNNIIRATTTSRHGLCSARRLKAIYFHNTTCHTPLPPPPPPPPPPRRVLSFRRNYTRLRPPLVSTPPTMRHAASLPDYSYIYPCSTVAVRTLYNRYYGCVRPYFAVGRGSAGAGALYGKNVHDFVHTTEYTATAVARRDV